MKVVIIGGVATGPKTAARLMRLMPDAKVTVVERQDILSYAGCGIPFYIEDVIKDWNQLLGGKSIRDAAYFKKRKGFTVLTKTEATGINRAEKTVTVRSLETGETSTLPYDKLVLATGASPIVPRIEGVELKGIHRIYNPYNGRAIKNQLKEKPKVVIVGGGLIGIETCGAFIAQSCSTTIVEMKPTLVPNILDEEMALLLENHVKSKGGRVIKGSPVAEIIGDGEGNVKGVMTRDGEKIDADMVILAIGVKPNTELAAAAGLEIGPTGAISVNKYLQTSDPDIYAGGDCVECVHGLTGEKVYAPLGSTANKHGRVIADNIAGLETSFPGIYGTTVFKVLDWNCGATGLTEKKAKALGYDVVTALTPCHDYAGYILGSKRVIIKLVADRKTSKIIGCQVVGEGEGVKRIDVVATALKYGATTKDIADIDLGYAPPYSTAIDAIAHAANVIRNKIQGIAHGVTPLELKDMLDGRSEFTLLDVRSRKEHEEISFKDPRTINIPLDELRERYLELDRDREIIIFCAVGVRAYIAERVLRGLGYGKTRFLEGSITAWPFPDYLG